MGLKPEKIRKDFPILNTKIKGKPIIYFDNACQTLRPQQVIDKINEYYRDYPACGERSHHKLGKRVDEELEKARKIFHKFFNTKHKEEIIFTKNTTEGINIIANAIEFQKGDAVLCSDKEHNSNLLPWQIKKNIKHNIFEFGNIEDFQNKLTKDTRLVSVVHTSNMDGTSNPVKEMIKIAHDNKSLIHIDGAQSAPHREINLKKLDADFFTCSGHKMLGPSGTGLLFGKKDILEKLNPPLTGGGTVDETTYTTHGWEKLPQRFEPGLQNYAGMIGLGEALRYLDRIGLKNIENHEKELNKRAEEQLAEVNLLGKGNDRAGIFSFNIEKLTPHNIAIMLDNSANIMIRSGAHCVHSWFNKHKMTGSARASFYLYNTEQEIDRFIEEVKKIIKHFR
ncbi:cysteine desulfurase [Candidatus Woesearchaeota archaeon]|nr:cysteine desulfurase [Candidatus Woesearchaeota archaeon]MBW3014286.1 cysteine desulfurase [Candidatus Woesearchaeota archaeon]